jgi:GT2 family glycosyltransferase
MRKIIMDNLLKKFRIIVVNYNSSQHLSRCLAALSNQTIQDFETIVIDNKSCDGSYERAASGMKPSNTVFLRNSENLGFARANNIAAAGATSEWIVTLNPDAFPAPDWLDRLHAATRRYPDVDMLGSTLLSAENAAILDGVGDCYAPWGVPWRGGHGHCRPDRLRDTEAFGPCAAAAAYRTRVFIDHGGFDERFFCYVEDVDLAFRMRLQGARCVQVADALVTHVGGGSGGAGSVFACYWGARNRVWLFMKCMPGILFWPMLPCHVLVNALLLLRAIPRRRFLAVSRGIVAALADLRAVLAQRRQVQGQRTASVRSLAAAMTWSPIRLARRLPPRYRDPAAI